MVRLRGASAGRYLRSTCNQVAGTGPAFFHRYFSHPPYWYFFVWIKFHQAYNDFLMSLVWLRVGHLVMLLHVDHQKPIMLNYLHEVFILGRLQTKKQQVMSLYSLMSLTKQWRPLLHYGRTVLKGTDHNSQALAMLTL